MEAKRETSYNSFTSVMALNQQCEENIPERYILPPMQRPDPSLVDHISSSLPVIDLSMLKHPAHKSQLIHEVHAACKKLGFFQVINVSNFTFQDSIKVKKAILVKVTRRAGSISFFKTVSTKKTVINHGIPTAVMKDALDSAEEFFNLPNDEKMYFASTDVHEPVRYGTSVNHGVDRVFYWRDFIKHYANPLSEWTHLWPSNPPSYKEKMGSYAKATHVLQKKLMEVVLESLGLNTNYLHDDVEEGSQVMAVNCYPSCPKPDLALGMPPHTDYGTLTILNQSDQGLEIMDKDNKWHSVPFIQGSLIIQLGDQLEVMSNGRYKSTPHRAVVSLQRKRLSIASLHSLPLEKKVGPAPQLVDEQHPIAYKEGSFGGFLDYISVKSLSQGKYIDTLKNP